MSHPSKVDKFIPWSKAMIAGATVGKPSYPGTRKSRQGKGKAPIKQQRRRRRKKVRHGSKD